MTHQYMEIKIKELEDRIKKLEQEPFMNKPCVAHQVCHEDKVKVLDKIRSEIMHLHDWVFSREEVLRIVDKYKAESEDV